MVRPTEDEQHRRPPAVLLIPALVGLAFLVLPLSGCSSGRRGRTLGSRLSQPGALTALRLSLLDRDHHDGRLPGRRACRSRSCSRVPGSRGRRLVRALVTLPLVLPPVVGGVALFTAFGRTGFSAMVVPEVRLRPAVHHDRRGGRRRRSWRCRSWSSRVEGALRAADSRYEEAAATLGASRWTAFRRVTLPLVAPGVAAGAVLCWARALGEFGATITFAGNFPGRTQTMPLAVYLALENDPDAAIAAEPGAASRCRSWCCRQPSGQMGRRVVTLSAHLRRRPRRLPARPLAGRRARRGGRAPRARTAPGKTTALRALAGLLRLSGGSITLDGVEIASATASCRRSAARVGVVFQDYLLFPHLSALDNVAFGPRCHGHVRGDGRDGSRPSGSTGSAWPTRGSLTPGPALRRSGAAGRARPRARDTAPAAAARRAAGRARCPHPSGRTRRSPAAPDRRSRAPRCS